MCGLIYEEMPRNSSYCFKHKQSVDALTSQLKKRKRDEVEGSSEALTKFEEMRNKKDSPPSNFSRMVYDFEAKCPSKGNRIARDQYDCAMLIEQQTTRTVGGKARKCVMMHQTRYIRFAQQELDMTVEEAEAKWAEYVEKTDEADTDQNGPPQHRLRLPITAEDSVYMAQETEHSKSLLLSGLTRRRGITPLPYLRSFISSRSGVSHLQIYICWLVVGLF